LSQELITYIVLGSSQHLANKKEIKTDSYEEFIKLNFENIDSFIEELDLKIAESRGEIIVLLPPSSIPNKKTRLKLQKIASMPFPSWGWFKFNKFRKNISQDIKKILTRLRSIPDFEQGIYFSKNLYFSIGGFGKIEKNIFSEISRRLYSRLDPQKPLPALIIRSKKIKFK
jgi:hypothetical protein